jgi:glycogen operon protein
VNFITCHDGFTLADLVSFNGKHNDANGEGNRDGGDDNHSWNCGAEGWTDDPVILSLRKRQIMNAMAILFTSRGIPMVLMGDEFGRSQHGNNNAYCLDSPVSWVDWSLLQSNRDLHQYVKALIHFRNRHPALRVNHFEEDSGLHLPSCSFHGQGAWSADWSDESRQLAWMMTAGLQPNGGGLDVVYVAANMAHFASWFETPEAPEGYRWRICFNTGDQNSPILASEPILGSPGLLLGERSVVILSASAPA